MEGFVGFLPGSLRLATWLPEIFGCEGETWLDSRRLNVAKDLIVWLMVARLKNKIFPDPSDFDRYCKLKDRLPSIVVEPTEGDVESGELRWPPEEFLVQEEEEEEEENCEDAKKDNKEQ
ncbi:protein hypothetical protein [Limosa lapponica baueri]|uniref:Protein LBH n=1 Tax=Limosa lapponica baueri TaxID=1758121 RepID=A0A2I0U481_LIMLA|nr:protein hypothetical protein [Limosa lapponica baueri]